MNLKEIIEKVLSEEENNVYNSNGIKINVYGKEGNNPHLHYYFPNVEGCIRLDIPRYFCHETHHEGLNVTQRKIIINWLNKNWKKCVEIWNKDSKQEKSKLPTTRLQIVTKTSAKWQINKRR